MSKKRTKKQKVRATYHYAYPAERSFVGVEGSTDIASKPTIVEKTDFSRLYQYDLQFIRKDLAKTLLITAVVIAAEIGLYFLIKV